MSRTTIRRNITLPVEVDRMLQDLSYRNLSTASGEIQRLIKEEMKREQTKTEVTK